MNYYDSGIPQFKILGSIPSTPIPSTQPTIAPTVSPPPLEVDFFAGSGIVGVVDAIGTNSEFMTPFGISVSPTGSFALVTDSVAAVIRHIELSTRSVTTLAGVVRSSGSTNGVGTNSRFATPFGVSISSSGYFALVGDSDNNLIRLIDISTASVTTLAGFVKGSTDGIGTNSNFFSPYGVSISPDGSFALVADLGNHLIRRLEISSADVTTLAGLAGDYNSTNGIGTNARFKYPNGVHISPTGTFALVADTGNNLVRLIVLSTASVMTLAGSTSLGSSDGVGSNAGFSGLFGVAISPNGGYALVSELDNSIVRYIVISTGAVITLAGVAGVSGSTNGIGTNSLFYHPAGVSIDPSGDYALVADNYNSMIRKITLPHYVPPASCIVDDLSRVGDGWCDYLDYNTAACDWDGGDCCESTCVPRREECGSNSYFDCLDPLGYVPPASCIVDDLSRVGDGWCDYLAYNTAACGWDGGDCCESTCVPRREECGSNSYFDCLDPSVPSPSQVPSFSPSSEPTALPTSKPSLQPSRSPSRCPSSSPTTFPSRTPTRLPSVSPSRSPTFQPTRLPSVSPSRSPTFQPTRLPSVSPSCSPTFSPTVTPTTHSPTTRPTAIQTRFPTAAPSLAPSVSPTTSPSSSPTLFPIMTRYFAPTCRPLAVRPSPPTTATSAPTNAVVGWELRPARTDRSVSSSSQPTPKPALTVHAEASILKVKESQPRGGK
jgi:DNA-binding beta-propeller fold protein YncE